MPDRSRSVTGETDPPADPGPARRHAEFRDFDHLVHVFRGWDAAFHQLGRGPFRGELDVVRLGGVEVIRVTTNRAIQVGGCSPADAYGFSLVTQANEAAIWRGQRLAAGQLNVNEPAGVIDHRTAAGYENLMLRVDAEELRKAADVLLGIDLGERLSGVKALTPPREVAARLEAVVRGLLTGRQTCPTSTVLRLLVGSLASADPALRGPVRGANHHALVRRVEEFMRANLHRPLTDEDLCAEGGVSERTLRYAFRDVYGVSPMAYFKTLKLHAVRTRLKTADRATPIHAVARQWGFDHTGHFAADYFRLFGERPSATVGSAEPTA